MIQPLRPIGFRQEPGFKTGFADEFQCGVRTATIDDKHFGIFETGKITQDLLETLTAAFIKSRQDDAEHDLVAIVKARGMSSRA